MAHTEAKLQWHLEGDQDFKVRMSADLDTGVTITSITSVKLQKRTSTNPEIWQDTATVAASSQIVADDFDEDNLVANAAVYWTATADIDGDPVPGGGPYRWQLIVALSNGLDNVVKVTVDLVP